MLCIWNSKKSFFSVLLLYAGGWGRGVGKLEVLLFVMVNLNRVVISQPNAKTRV